MKKLLSAFPLRSQCLRSFPPLVCCFCSHVSRTTAMQTSKDPTVTPDFFVERPRIFFPNNQLMFARIFSLRIVLLRLIFTSKHFLPLPLAMTPFLLPPPKKIGSCFIPLTHSMPNGLFSAPTNDRNASPFGLLSIPFLLGLHSNTLRPTLHRSPIFVEHHTVS